MFFSGASVTAQYSNADKAPEKSPTSLVDKQKDTNTLKEKVNPVQDMQIGIPTAYPSPLKAKASQGEYHTPSNNPCFPHFCYQD